LGTQSVLTEQSPPPPGNDVLTWLGIDRETYLSGLQERIPDVTRHVCEAIGDDLLKIHPLLRPAFKIWWETGEIPNLGTFSGYTVLDLLTGAKKTTKFEPSGVFLILNTLITDPEKAKAQLILPVHEFIPAAGPGRVMPPRRKAAA